MSEVRVEKIYVPVPGPVGPQGDRGVPGPQGSIGIQGPVGPRGIDGPRGMDGIPGIAGRDGKDGRDGIDGKDGRDGAPGPKGDPGDVTIVGDKELRAAMLAMKNEKVKFHAAVTLALEEAAVLAPAQRGVVIAAIAKIRERAGV